MEIILTGKIYQFTHIPTGAPYIGQTTRTLEERNREHLTEKNPTKFQKIYQENPNDFEREVIENIIV